MMLQDSFVRDEGIRRPFVALEWVGRPEAKASFLMTVVQGLEGPCFLRVALRARNGRCGEMIIKVSPAYTVMYRV
jgi:hypothetical protein